MTRKIGRKQWTVTASGGAGTSTGNADNPLGTISGEIISLHLDYSASAAATTDVVITRKADGTMPTETLLTVSNNATDAWYYPRAGVVDASNSAITGGYTRFGIDGYLNASVAQANDGDTVTITVIYESM